MLFAALSQDGQLDLLTRFLGADQHVELLEVDDHLVVHLLQDVVFLQPRSGGRAVRGDVPHRLVKPVRQSQVLGQARLDRRCVNSEICRLRGTARRLLDHLRFWLGQAINTRGALG